jgi:glyoxylase-like metal-dependent hydrolase (beta-lactamase superfamily II)
MLMRVQKLIVGMFRTNCYVSNCEERQESIIIHLGFDDPRGAERILKFMDEKESTLKPIVNTHGHQTIHVEIEY